MLHIFKAYILTDLTITTHPEQLFFHREIMDLYGLVDEQVLCAMRYAYSAM